MKKTWKGIKTLVSTKQKNNDAPSLTGFDNRCTSRTYVPLPLLAYAQFWTCVR